MQVELIIRADSMTEISHLFVANPPGANTRPPQAQQPQRVLGDEAANGAGSAVRMKEVGIEEAPEETASPKPRKGRSAAKATQGAPTEEATTGPTATTDASPSDEKVTFEDIRAEASSLMDSGKVDAKAIQEMLVAKFDARAFGAVKEEDYPRCLDELRNLA